MAEQFGFSRKTANMAVRRLESEGLLVRVKATTHPSFALGPRRERLFDYSTEQAADENLCWVRDFEPFFDLSDNVKRICHHGFTEILNNAHDHSDGTAVRVMMLCDGKIVQLVISDNGVGVFKRIADALNLPDLRLALLELSKGKFTTDRSNHSGEGIFFTSKMFDHFLLRSNDQNYEHTAGQKWGILHENGVSTGTTVTMSIPLNSTRTAQEVFNEYASESFNKTVIPVRLARLGTENLVSRSQAKRLIARFEQFQLVVLDFLDVTEVGQAFADELFRVFPREHPEVQLVRKNSCPAVESAILRAMGERIPAS
jgi:DNA-binding Lrp family transcriptional regulator